METSEKPAEQAEQPQPEAEQPTSEHCNCNALPLPHVHDEQGIHYPEK